MTDRPGHPASKHSILRAVYEDNVGLRRVASSARSGAARSASPTAAGTARSRRRLPAWGVMVGLWAVLLPAPPLLSPSVSSALPDVTAVTTAPVLQPLPPLVPEAVETVRRVDPPPSEAPGDLTLPAAATDPAAPDPSGADGMAWTGSLLPADALPTRADTWLTAALDTDPEAVARHWQVPDLGDRPWNLAPLVQDDAVPLAELFGLQVRTIVIDPGHGGRDTGAVGPDGVMEKEIALDVALRLKARLEASGLYRILLTREDDRWMSLRSRVRFANRAEADLFVSVHVNALPVPAPPVIETYYFGPQSDADALRLAAFENRDSGYPVAQFRRLIQGLDKTLRHQESRQLAGAVQHSLYQALSPHSEGIINVGIKTAPFMVLLGVDMPSILAEVTCLSNPAEEQRLTDPEYRGRIARALEQGILTYLNHHRSNPDKGAHYAGQESRGRG